MKKILLLLVVALLIAGCGAEQTTEESTTEPTTEEQTTVEVTEPAAEETAPTEEAAEEPVVEETTEEIVEEVAEETATESIVVEGCTDSDNGKDYAIAGTMADINGIEDHDICSTNENYPGRLYEVYCKEDGKHGRETYDCPSGVCQSGTCVEATE